MTTPPTLTSRRSLLRAGAVSGGALAGAAPLASAVAAPRPRGSSSRRVLAPADRHLVNRFSYGHTPELARQVRLAGGAQAWFRQQLRPATISDGAADSLVGWWPSLTRTPLDLWLRNTGGIEGSWEVMADYQRWTLVRRIMTKRPVAEMMTEFWLNHFNVPVNHDAVFTYRFAYDQAVRRQALGTFEDLLRTAILHPAMGMYLDNAVSTKDHPNENLGRELLELHTVGLGAFDEADVQATARLLTGFQVDMWRTWQAGYAPLHHWTGAVSILGFSSPNAAADGRPAVEAFLRHLAHHPATARRIVRKLCVKFVRDDPSEALVSRLAAVYLERGTAIVPVLQALVASPEFAAAAAMKVRDPAEEMVATYRALGVTLSKPPPGEDSHAASTILWQTLAVGAVPYEWPRPDGQPADNASWSSPARLMASMETHWAMSGGWWPNQGIGYRTPAEWLPASRVRFDRLVGHLAEQMLGRPGDDRLLAACVEACPDDWGVTPTSTITLEHPLVRWGFHRLLVTILDSPDHFTR